MKVASGRLARSSGDDEVWPPGFRFHPTDEELILYYLKRKICGRKIKLDIIGDTDVYKWQPEELPGLSKLKTGDRQWFFFSPRDRKYPNGARSNRATRHGYWKATGKDRTVTCDSRDVGVKKTLIFYKGRAPNGERTDWVMHEYTLDEEELNRCTNVQNYYALYKVFKKSGPGPKNGEQYGAPFKEEDWADDAFYGFNSSNEQEMPVEKPDKVAAAVEERKNCEETLFSLEDLEELMKQIPDEAIFEFPQADPCANTLPQVAGQEESVSTVVESGDHIFHRSVEVSHTNRQLCNAGGSFDFTESAISQLQSFEAREPLSNPNICEQASVLFEDDFLEIDDLDGPEFTLSRTEKAVGSLQFGELNGLCELDQFHDAAMFLNDLGPFDFVSVPDLYQSENSYNLSNPLDGQFQSNLDSANANQIVNQMQMHDQAMNAFACSESHKDSVAQQTPGVLSDTSNFAAETNQNQVSQDGSTSSCISSALWAFIESIPTTPASAAENALVNRTFNRMSSLSRRISTKSMTVSATDSPSQTTRRAGRSSRFFLFSVLGVLCAVLWVFIGAVSPWERCVSLSFAYDKLTFNDP